MPAARAFSSSAVSPRPDVPITGTWPAGPGNARIASRRRDAVHTGQRHVHQHRVIAVGFDRIDRRLAAFDEIDLVAELAQDRVHHHAAVGVVFGAQDRERARRHIGDAVHDRRGLRRHALDLDGEAEGAALAGLADHLEIAAHGLGDALDEDEAKASAAKAAGDMLAGLRERAEQALQLGRAHAEPGVGEREDEAQPVARGRLGGGAERDRAFLREFHRIVGEVFQRRPQPQSVAGDHRRQIGRDVDLGRDVLVGRARGERFADRFGQHAWRERLAVQREPGSVGLGGIDNQRGERGQMIGAALDRVRPLALALAEIGGREQFGQRHDTGERGADVVGDAGERRFDRARRGRRLRLGGLGGLGGLGSFPRFRRAHAHHAGFTPRRRLAARPLFGCTLSHAPLPRKARQWHGT